MHLNQPIKVQSMAGETMLKYKPVETKWFKQCTLKVLNKDFHRALFKPICLNGLLFYGETVKVREQLPNCQQVNTNSKRSIKVTSHPPCINVNC